MARTADAHQFSPRLLLAHADASYAAACTWHFRRLGWEVDRVETAEQARRAVHTQAPAVVVLAAELPDESGWLTCSKLVREQPGLKVVLVAGCLTPEDRAFAVFVGASGVVSRAEGVQALLAQVQGSAVLVSA